MAAEHQRDDDSVLDDALEAPHPSDAQLVEAAAGGNWEAFRGIFDRYARRLYGFCVMAAGERAGGRFLLQETFVQAHAQLGRMQNGMELRPWLLAIALRVIRTYRAGQTLVPVEVPTPGYVRPGPDDEFVPLLRELRADAIVNVIASVGPVKERTFLEHYFRSPHEPAVASLASQLGVPPTLGAQLIARVRLHVTRLVMSTLAKLDHPVADRTGAIRVERPGPAQAGCPLEQLERIEEIAYGLVPPGELGQLADHLSRPCPSCDASMQSFDLGELLAVWAERIETSRLDPRPGELGNAFRTLGEEVAKRNSFWSKIWRKVRSPT